MSGAKYRRLFGFDAGPENHMFYLCEKHKGEVPMCFHALVMFGPVRLANTDECDDDIQCDLCREG